jgi:hypothetical protein
MWFLRCAIHQKTRKTPEKEPDDIGFKDHRQPTKTSLGNPISKISKADVIYASYKHPLA